MQTNLEVLTVESGGIKVRVMIDYDKQKVSLIDNNNNPKKYVFASRELNYIDEWFKILGAMNYAMSIAKEKLEKHKEEKDKEFENKIIKHYE